MTDSACMSVDTLVGCLAIPGPPPRPLLVEERRKCPISSDGCMDASAKEEKRAKKNHFTRSLEQRLHGPPRHHAPPPCSPLTTHPSTISSPPTISSSSSPITACYALHLGLHHTTPPPQTSHPPEGKKKKKRMLPPVKACCNSRQQGTILIEFLVSQAGLPLTAE
ncbi:hypothetical protein CSOJ01_01092 [Colletotrichum sojae]|uniref:Uncharacterized protein n=1 Tax=Colletotrichum sojae TaxID=2175907 RepID=A0A8H6N4I9_9PEZI|nr:hypothetical protein CSOJ01_01092 [Colletotrichum sojae]